MNVNNYLAYIYSDSGKDDRPEGVLYGVFFSGLWVLFGWIGGYQSPIGVGISVSMTFLFVLTLLYEIVFLIKKFTVRNYFRAKAVLAIELFLQNSLLLALAYCMIGGFSLFSALTTFIPPIFVPVALGVVYAKRLKKGIHCGRFANSNRGLLISLSYAAAVVFLNWKFLYFSFESTQLTVFVLTVGGLVLECFFASGFLIFQKIYFLHKLEQYGYISPSPQAEMPKTADEAELKGILLLTEYLRFSKCPNCRKHGILALGKIYLRRHSEHIVTCKYCGKSYAVSPFKTKAAAILILIACGILLATVSANVVNIPRGLCFVIIFALFYVYEYFAPLDEPDSED